MNWPSHCYTLGIPPHGQVQWPESKKKVNFLQSVISCIVDKTHDEMNKKNNWNLLWLNPLTISDANEEKECLNNNAITIRHQWCQNEQKELLEFLLIISHNNRCQLLPLLPNKILITSPSGFNIVYRITMHKYIGHRRHQACISSDLIIWLIY